MPDSNTPDLESLMKAMGGGAPSKDASQKPDAGNEDMKKLLEALTKRPDLADYSLGAEPLNPEYAIGGEVVNEQEQAQKAQLAKAQDFTYATANLAKANDGLRKSRRGSNFYAITPEQSLAALIDGEGKAGGKLQKLVGKTPAQLIEYIYEQEAELHEAVKEEDFADGITGTASEKSKNENSRLARESERMKKQLKKRIANEVETRSPKELTAGLAFLAMQMADAAEAEKVRREYDNRIEHYNRAQNIVGENIDKTRQSLSSLTSARSGAKAKKEAHLAKIRGFNEYAVATHHIDDQKDNPTFESKPRSLTENAARIAGSTLAAPIRYGAYKTLKDAAKDVTRGIIWKTVAENTKEYDKLKEINQKYLMEVWDKIHRNRLSPFRTMLESILQNPEYVNRPDFIQMIEALEKADEKWQQQHDQSTAAIDKKTQELLKQHLSRIKDVKGDQDTMNKWNYMAAMLVISTLLPGISAPQLAMQFLEPLLTNGSMAQTIVQPMKFILGPIFDLVGLDIGILERFVEKLIHGVPVIKEMTELIEFGVTNDITGPLVQNAATLFGSNHVIELGIGAYFATQQGLDSHALLKKLSDNKRDYKKNLKAFLKETVNQENDRTDAMIKSTSKTLVDCDKSQSMLQYPYKGLVEIYKAALKGAASDADNMLKKLDEISPEIANVLRSSEDLILQNLENPQVSLDSVLIDLMKAIDPSKNPKVLEDIRLAQALYDRKGDFSKADIDALTPDARKELIDLETAFAQYQFYKGKTDGGVGVYRDLDLEAKKAGLEENTVGYYEYIIREKVGEKFLADLRGENNIHSVVLGEGEAAIDYDKSDPQQVAQYIYAMKEYVKEQGLLPSKQDLTEYRERVDAHLAKVYVREFEQCRNEIGYKHKDVEETVEEEIRKDPKTQDKSKKDQAQKPKDPKQQKDGSEEPNPMDESFVEGPTQSPKPNLDGTKRLNDGKSAKEVENQKWSGGPKTVLDL
ncbi:MAG: hypothetical protein O3B09_01055 [Proteobacteria bacterium]|nr:hypothetical protein [Pseudomonadota bacterium]